MSGEQTYTPFPDYAPCDIGAGRKRGGDEPRWLVPIKRPPAYQRLLELD